MTISVDATSTSSGSGGTTSFSWSHTVSGSGRVLIVALSYVENTTNVPSLSSATYNSVALDVIYHDIPTTSNDGGVLLLGMKDPPTGSNTISITVSQSIRGRGGAISFNAAEGWRTYTRGSGSGTLPSVTPESLSGDYVVDVVSTNGNIDTTLTKGASQTLIFSSNVTGTVVPTNGDHSMHGMSYRTSTGGVTNSWTLGTSAGWQDLGVAVSPLGVGGGAMISPMGIF